MNEKMIEMKTWLKETAIKIRASKQKQKQHQRENNGRYDWRLLNETNGLRHTYRIEHIAYSLYRGRTMEEIERPGEKNQPDMQAINLWLETLKSGEPAKQEA